MRLSRRGKWMRSSGSFSKYEGKNKYREDAFIRYVTGVLYESRGGINDAFIAYRKSL